MLAQRDRDRLLRLRHAHARTRLHRQEERVRLVDPELRVEQLVRHDRARLGARRREDVLGRHIESDHLHRSARHLDGAPDRADPTEEPSRHRLLHHHHARARLHLVAREPATLGQPTALHLDETGVRAEDAGHLRALAEIREARGTLAPERGVLHFGKLRDELGLLEREVGADPHPGGGIVGVDRRARVDLHHVERGGPGHLDGADDLRAQPFDERGHRHHGRHADHHAEDRERRAELRDADRLHRDAEVLPILVEQLESDPHHSERIAVIGSSRAARRAG